jgi:Domain of unknown function (DUF4157)
MEDGGGMKAGLAPKGHGAETAKRRGPARLGMTRPPAAPTLGLQPELGNQSIQRLLKAGAIQAKLAVGSPDDPLEHEADRVADQVMRMPAPASGLSSAPPQVSRKCAACEEADKLQKKEAGSAAPVSSLSSAPLHISRKCAACEEEKLQKKDAGSAAPVSWLSSAPLHISRKCAACEEEEKLQKKDAGSAAPASAEAPSRVHEVLRSAGQPLDAPTRAFFEPRFGRDLSEIRVHADGQAADSARAVNALAYTAGHHVVFGAGAYGPQSDAGRKLLAHELAHTIQQSSHGSALDQGLEIVRRRPDEIWAPPKSPSDFFSPNPPSPMFPPGGIGATAYDDPLYFAERVPDEGCTSCHPTAQRPLGGPVPAKLERVDVWNLRMWAVRRIWGKSGGRISKSRLLSVIQQREDKALHDIWDSYRAETIAIVSNGSDVSDRIFTGSENARRFFAKYLSADWGNVEADLDRLGVDALVKEINEALHSGLVLSRAHLETDPNTIGRIDSGNPERETIEIGNKQTLAHDTVTVGWVWQKKRVKSISGQSLYFEVIGHEGVYFKISKNDFLETDPYWTKFTSDIGAATAGMVVLGKFIKGALNALASPIKIAAETGARVIDMATMYIAADVKSKTGLQIPYTCLSSICQDYDKCLDDETKTPGECKSDAFSAAWQEATIIIPLYQQGKACLTGKDPEACGAIATLAIGLVEEGAGRLSPREAGEARVAGGKVRAARGRKALSTGELEEAEIRDVIGRPRADDPNFERARDAPKQGGEGAPSPRGKREPLKTEPPPSGKQPPLKPLKPEDARRLKQQIDRVAPKLHVTAEQLEAEVTQIRRDATDPAKVRQPTDPNFAAEYDAEMTTSVGEKHTYRRKKSTQSIWCRFSPGPGDCGEVPVGPETDQAVSKIVNERKGEFSWRRVKYNDLINKYEDVLNRHDRFLKKLDAAKEALANGDIEKFDRLTAEVEKDAKFYEEEESPGSHLQEKERVDEHDLERLGNVSDADIARFHWKVAEQDLNSVAVTHFPDLPPELWRTRGGRRFSRRHEGGGRRSPDLRTAYTDLDAYHPGVPNVHPPVSLEAKAWKLGASDDFVYSTARQALDRAHHVPVGTEQWLVIDLRGQEISPADFARIESELERLSNGQLHRSRIITIN